MFRRMLAAATLTIITLSPVAASSRADTGVYKQTLPAVAWVNTREGSNEYTGTAFVVDVKNRMLVTNFHVAGKADRISLYFPERKNGQVVTDRDWYLSKGHRIRARLVVADSTRDLAVIQAEELPDGVKELKLAADSPAVGEDVFTVGHPAHEDDLWIGNTSTVRSVKKIAITLMPGRQEFNGVAQESGLAVSQGASGSPVVNAAGELVGVVFCGNGNANAGKPSTQEFSVDVREVRTVLVAANKKLGKDDTGVRPSPTRPEEDGRPEGHGKKPRLLPIEG